MKRTFEMKFDKEITEAEKRLAKLNAEKAEFEKMPFNQQLAVFLHESECISDHTSFCGWEYEMVNGDHNWNQSSHNTWLKKANVIIAKSEELNLSMDKVMEMYKALR